MKTADLISRLARNAAPVAKGAVARRLLPPAAIGFAATAALVVLWLGLRSFDVAIQTSAFWMKAGYTILLSIAGAGFVAGLARPGGRIGSSRWIAVVAFAVLLGLGAAEYLTAAPGERLALWLGGSWNVCACRIVTLSAPIYAGLLFGLRKLAPTRPATAGAAAGFLAGALGATAYQLFCPETGAMFVATWYSLGVAASAAIGALLGSRLLRW